MNEVIDDSDILLLVLDSRLIDDTRNAEIEDKVRKRDKPLIFVLTKCDLVDKNKVEKEGKKLNPSVFISSTARLGLSKLRERILIEAGKAKVSFDKIRVGVLGYPNVGKSSLINAMKGKKSAPTSVTSGFTKGVQKIRTDNRLYMLDTPGVIPYKEKDRMKHTMIGTIDYMKAKDPDLVVMELMERFPGKVEAYYEVFENEDKEETLEDIARKRNILKRGKEPDVMRMARMILAAWQKGDIK